jgi:hypothetical protein
MSKAILTMKSIFARKLAIGIKLIANGIISAGRNVTKTVIFVPSRSNDNYLVDILKLLNAV